MGLLVQSTSIRNAAKPKLQSAHRSAVKSDDDAASAAATDAVEVETTARTTTINTPLVAILAIVLMFVIGAGIVADQLALKEWGDTLRNTFGILGPLLIGYFGGEFVAEKTK